MTMKKIKNIPELKAEKKRLRHQQAALEDKIRGNWKELKNSVKPVNLAKEAWQDLVEKKTAAFFNGDNVLKSTLTYGVTLLAQKMGAKAKEKFTDLFKKRAGRE